MTDPRSFAEIISAFQSHGRHGRYHATWHDVFSGCESPIERKMADALRTVAADLKYELCPAYSDAPGDALLDYLRPRFFWIMSQRKIVRYRADLVMLGLDIDDFPRPMALDIECDGRDWHSSATQVACDIRRALEIEKRGIRVKCFTGHDIHVRGYRCAVEIFSEFIPDAKVQVAAAWAREGDA